MLHTRFRLKLNGLLFITIRQLEDLSFNQFIEVSRLQVKVFIIDFPIIRFLILILKGFNYLIFELFGGVVIAFGLLIDMKNGTDFMLDAFVGFGGNGLLLVGMDHGSPHLNFRVLFFHNN
jgi:hypothetical protein